MNGSYQSLLEDIFNRVFGDANPGLLKLIRTNGTFHELMRGEQLFGPGIPVKEVFLVLEGRIKLIDAEAVEGNVTILNLFTEGDFMGFMPVIREIPYYRTAVGLSERSVVYGWKKESFLDAIRLYPRSILPLVRQVEQEIDQLFSRAHDLANSNSLERLAQILLLLDRKFGHGSDGVIGLECSPQELAGLIGTTRTTVYRHLKTLSRQGLAEVHNSRLQIMDSPALLRLAYSH